MQLRNAEQGDKAGGVGGKRFMSLKCSININEVIARTVIKLTYILHYRFRNFDHEINCTSEPTDNCCRTAATSAVKHPTYMLWAINTPNHRKLGTATQFQLFSFLPQSVAHQVQQLKWPTLEAFGSLNSTLIAFSWWQRPALSYPSRLFPS